MSDSARGHCKTRGCVRHSRVSVPVQCHILLRCARGLNRDQVSLSEDGRADREDGERGRGGPLGGIQLFEPSVCNGMARLGGDKPIGKPSRAVSRCGLGLWMARRRLQRRHTAGLVRQRPKVSRPRRPRRGAAPTRKSIAGPSGRNGERVSHKPAAPVAQAMGVQSMMGGED